MHAVTAPPRPHLVAGRICALFSIAQSDYVTCTCSDASSPLSVARPPPLFGVCFEVPPMSHSHPSSVTLTQAVSLSPKQCLTLTQAASHSHPASVSLSPRQCLTLTHPVSHSHPSSNPALQWQAKTGFYQKVLPLVSYPFLACTRLVHPPLTASAGAVLGSAAPGCCTGRPRRRHDLRWLWSRVLRLSAHLQSCAASPSPTCWPLWQ